MTVLHDPSPVPGLSEEALRGRRLALLQTALLEHAARHHLRTVMTFHQRVEEAAAFAEKMPQTAARLYATETSENALAVADALPESSIGAEFYELEAGRHVPPERVWSAWLCGDHLVAERREVLRQFADGIDAGNKRVHRAFLASVRVLGEGVDIVGERGVEAICFADTRGSQVEIVQNIGRALRPNPDGTNKIARIIVPVFLKPGEDPADMVASASFAPLVAVLQGLRSHSERLVEQLASRGLTSGQRHVHVKRDEDGRIVGTSAEGEDGQHESEGAVESALLHFSTPRDAATIAAFLRTRVYRPESLVWLEGYQALLRWRKDNHITGLYAVPTTPRRRWASPDVSPWGGGSTSSGAPTVRASSTTTARRCSTRRGWCGSPATKPGRTNSRPCAPSTAPTATSPSDATPYGATPTANWSRSGNTWPTSAARTASARTRSAPQRGPRSWPRSTPTGTAPGHWTGNATTASWPTSPPTNPTADSPTSSPACNSKETTSANGSSDNAAAGRNSPRNSSNG
jgi:hypothetical protein